jgi:hypothetical protein
MLLPQWNQKNEEKYLLLQQQQQQTQQQRQRQPKKVLILVSGVEKLDACHEDGKFHPTVCQGQAMLCPNLVSRLGHCPDPFRKQHFCYNKNIAFLQDEFMPRIQSWRDAHAKGLPYPNEVSSSSAGGCCCGGNDDTTIATTITAATYHPFLTKWRKSLSVTLSFADGLPARKHAIQVALRPYPPTYFHCWQLKTFWNESKIVNSDIEVGEGIFV